LASKVKGKVSSPAPGGGGGGEADGGGSSKLSCHSDYVDGDKAKEMQGDQLVQVDVRPALGIGKEDRVV
ncbi:MAG: hypothetical protein COB69_10020, partial [Phycisphaera sp.]